jgi:hypothetical protein
MIWAPHTANTRNYCTTFWRRFNSLVPLFILRLYCKHFYLLLYRLTPVLPDFKVRELCWYFLSIVIDYICIITCTLYPQPHSGNLGSRSTWFCVIPWHADCGDRKGCVFQRHLLIERSWHFPFFTIDGKHVVNQSEASNNFHEFRRASYF